MYYRRVIVIDNTIYLDYLGTIVILPPAVESIVPILINK